MARISTPPVPASIYRNFAAVTLCATAVLAIFADSEGRQAHAASPPDANPPALATAEPAAEPRYAAEEDFSSGELGGGFGSEFSFAGGGQGTWGMDVQPRDLAYVEADHAAGKPALAPGSYGPGGLNPEELARLTEEERRALEMLTKASADHTAVRRQEIARLRRASLARSGSGSSDDL